MYLQSLVGLSLQPWLVVRYLYRYNPEHQSIVFEVLNVLVGIVVELSV